MPSMSLPLRSRVHLRTYTGHSDMQWTMGQSDRIHVACCRRRLFRNSPLSKRRHWLRLISKGTRRGMGIAYCLHHPPIPFSNILFGTSSQRRHHLARLRLHVILPRMAGNLVLISCIHYFLLVHSHAGTVHSDDLLSA